MPDNPPQPDKAAPKQPEIGHKALLEMHLSFSSEVDPNSEEVKTFLKAISDISKGRTSDPKTEEPK